MKGFVNPYNFIKFPKKKETAYGEEDRHTGVIKYTITTKTPLFIPNSSSECAFSQSDEAEKHKSYDFFSYTELDPKKRYDTKCHIPVIPGSEMRGVVRNVYETLTDSCMGLLNTDEYPVKRSMEKFKPALIYRNQKGEFSLYEAKALRIGEAALKNSIPKGFEKVSNGALIYYQEPDRNDDDQPQPIMKYTVNEELEKYSDKGYLLKWGMGLKKKRYHVFVINEDEDSDKDIHLSKDIIERKLLRVVDSYLSEPTVKPNDKAAYEEYQKDVENFLMEKKEGYFPVNYSKMSNGIYYLAPATLTKEVSDNTLGKLAGKFEPCEKNYCPACELFGYVGKNNESCKGSRIRFSDMYVTKKLEEEKLYYIEEGKPITIQALGGPKLGNVEFYLKKPEGANFWTYDYYISKKQQEVIRAGELRGRKYYWHHQEMDLHRETDKKKINKLNKTIRPVKDEMTFRGELYFEGISRKQMNQLIWILNSGSEGLGLKLGGAKPFGYGSISCKVEEVVERNIEVKAGKIKYNLKPISTMVSYDDAGLSKEVKEEFYKIAGLNSVPKNVEITYPKDKGQKGKPLTKGYSWFVNNHKTLSGGMARGRADVKIERVLPEIMDEDFSMEYNEKPQGNSKFSNHKGKRTGQQNQRRNQGDKRPYYQNGKDRRR